MNDKLTVRDIVDSIMEYSYTVDIAVNENEIGDAIDNFESQIYKVVIDAVIEKIQENTEGTFSDEGGNDCWYIDKLVEMLGQMKGKL